ncbi:unnamed protein product [Ectocarpus fasciculatus]
MGKVTLEEYIDLFRGKAEQMGEFPDKIIINALTGTAKRHRTDKAQAIATVLQNMLMDPSHPAKHKLPICFLVDSLVKNITDPFADLFENGLTRWFCSAYDAVDEKSKKHLARVVATWEVQSIFSADKRKEIQRYMLNAKPAAASISSSSPSPPPVTTTASTSAAVTVTTVPPPLPTVAPYQPPQQPQAPPAAPVAAAAAPLPPPLPPLPPASAVATAVAAPVAASVAAPVAAPVAPDIQAMVDSRMKQLLDQQLLELGESSTMSLDDLWRTNAELASGFRLVAQAQVHEQLGLPPPPPPPAIIIGPLQQQQQQQQPPPPHQTAPPLPQDFGRAVQVANEVAAGARVALDASLRGDLSGAQVQAAEAAGKAAMLACLLGGDAAAAVGGGLGGGGGGAGVGVYLTDLDPLDVRSLARGNPAAVRRLYGEGFPFWCKQDGTRFAKQAQLDAHMDLLFRRKHARREQKGAAASREWYCTDEEWMTDFGRLAPPAGSGAGEGEGEGEAGGSGDGEEDGGAGEDADPDGSKSCVPADERFSKCRICGDRFLMFYDNDEEEWMYRNACYVTVRGGGEGEGGAGEDEEEEEEEEEVGAPGEAAGGARQIIVHKLCLDVSGLRDKDEITWADLMPGTPRQKKRPAEGGDALDAAFFGDDGDDAAEREDEKDGVGETGDSSGTRVGDSGGGDGGGDANGGRPHGEGEAEDDGPPLKRAKAEGAAEGENGFGGVDATGVEKAEEGGSGAGQGEAYDMDEELDFEA